MDYDVVVIGSGPAGYVAAIRCAQLKFKTALVERYSTLGGTCLNVGCIPSKALLDSSEHYHQAVHKFTTHGIEIDKINVNFAQMIKRKDKVVSVTCDGVQYLMKKNKIDVYHGHASFVDSNTVKISGEEEKNITTKNTIIATGSKPASLPNVPIDKKRIITSTEALSLPEIPNKLIVIGGGIIGLELGSVYARLGTDVEVIEYLDTLIGTMDRTLGKELQRVLKKLGMKFSLQHAVQEAKVEGDKVIVRAKDKKGQEVSFEGDYCLVSVGRKPYTQNLGLENIGLELDQRGRIPVNDNLETTVKGVFAIGDVVRGPMLAHKGEEEGVYVAEFLAGQKPHINYRAIPSVVYTWPEAAGVGYTEEELKSEGKEYKVGQFPFKALGRARASDETDGLVKVLADKATDEILGVHMIGPRAADMIAEAVVAYEYRASAEDIARISHAHPTFTEAVKEAALDATGKRALHS